MIMRKPLAQFALVLGLSISLVACASGPGGPEEGGGPPGRGRGGPRRGGQPPSRPEEAWKAYDLNGDGKVTRAEFAAVRNLCFVRADANGDGVLTRVEIQAVRGEPRGVSGTPTASRPGRDDESEITREEFDRAGDSLWRTLDSNGDTVIAGMELAGLSAAAQSDLCRPSVSPPSRDGRAGPAPRGGPGPGDRR